MKATFEDGCICIHYRPWVDGEQEKADKAFEVIKKVYKYPEMGSTCILVDENSDWGDFRSFKNLMAWNGLEV